jgi:hypothetical protein
MADDATGYYLLAFVPQGKRREGEFRELDVDVKRPGVELFYRHGFVDRLQEEVSTSAVLTAVKNSQLFSSPGLRAEAATEGAQLTVITYIPTSLLRFRVDEQVHYGGIEIFGFLFDSEGEWVGQSVLFSKGRNLQLSEEQVQGLKNYANVTLTGEADTPGSGDYQLVVAVRQSADGSISACSSELKIE